MQRFRFRRRPLLAVIVLCFLLVPAASGKPLKPKVNEPKYYDEAMFGIDEVRTNVGTVDCGGWSATTSPTVKNGAVMNGNVPIPTVEGLPGRKNVGATADAKTGVGTRGPFEYPNDTYGFVSACDVHLQTMYDYDLDKLDVNLEILEDGSVQRHSPALIDPVKLLARGTVHINPHRWCLLDNPEFATPKYCKMLFDAWRALAALADRPDPRGPLFCPLPEDVFTALNINPTYKEYCFDTKDIKPETDYTYECHGRDCATANPNGGQCNTVKLPGTFDTSLTECSFTTDADGNVNGVFIHHGGHKGDPRPSSFYRHYIGAFNAVNVPPPPPDAKVKVTAPTKPDKVWKLRGDCYEYYREDDPKECVTDLSYDQCELTIAIPNEKKPENPEWPAGNGRSQREQTKATVPDVTRQSRTVPDPWVADTDSSLLLIDTDKLKQQQQGFEDPADILGVLGTILPVRQTATHQVSVENGRTDMVDDTDHRAMASYWEAQQRELLRMIEDPKTKLVMPARFLTGLSDDDPLFQYVRNTESRPNGIVALTLRAGMEDFGNVLTSLARVYVAPVQDVRIPLLVPLAAASRIDSLIFDWQEWKQREDLMAMGTSGYTSRSSQADPFIAKLKAYRTAIEKVRLLRGAETTYAQKLLAPDQQIRNYVADWYQQNATFLLQAAQRSVQRRELKQIWRNIQQAMLVTDECQLLWCSNQRYSTPVYSLLDGWWGDRPAGSPRNAGFKPDDLRDLHYYPEKDKEFDFSTMKFPREPFLVPTLWPVQVKIRLPIPPIPTGKMPDINDYPDLPPVPDVHVFDSFPVPKVQLPPREILTVPALPDLSQAISILRSLAQRIGSSPLAATYDRGTMEGVYCRFPRSVTIVPDIDKGNRDRIVHVENDLTERASRLFARWMPNMEEDFGGRMARRQVEFPPPAKPACTEDAVCGKMPGEESRTVTWQWFSPVWTPNFAALAQQLKTSTLPATNDMSKNPYAAALPFLRVPFEQLPLPTIIDLVVPRTP